MSGNSRPGLRQELSINAGCLQKWLRSLVLFRLWWNFKTVISSETSRSFEDQEEQYFYTTWVHGGRTGVHTAWNSGRWVHLNRQKDLHHLTRFCTSKSLFLLRLWHQPLPRKSYCIYPGRGRSQEPYVVQLQFIPAKLYLTLKLAFKCCVSLSAGVSLQRIGMQSPGHQGSQCDYH